MSVNAIMYLLVEMTFFVVFFVCLRDAWLRGKQGDSEIERIENELAQDDPSAPRESWSAGHWLWVGIMVGAIFFTFSFEYALTHKSDAIYSYPVPALISPGGVPLWVPCGWALIMYLVMRTSDKLNLRWYKRPVLDGLMALLIDFALDPVATWNHWWVWDFSQNPDLEPTMFFGIPATNYMAWIVIVASFSFFVRLLQRWRMGRAETGLGRALSPWLSRLPRKWWVDFLLPVVASGPSFLVVIGYSQIGRKLMDTTNTAWYAGKWFSNGALLCSLVWAACLVWAYLDAPRTRRDHAHDLVLMTSPLALFSVILLAVYTTRVHPSDPHSGGLLLYEAMPELIILVPLTSILGIIVFAWPYSKPGPESWW